jgi:hypothetical protein
VLEGADCEVRRCEEGTSSKRRTRKKNPRISAVYFTAAIPDGFLFATQHFKILPPDDPWSVSQGRSRNFFFFGKCASIVFY